MKLLPHAPVLLFLALLAAPSAADIDVSALQRSGLAAAVLDDLRQAEAGDRDAQYRVAVRYDAADGVRRDFALAAQWYRRAAEQGHVAAAANLGVMLSEGQGVARNDAEAVHWLRRAAEAGDPLAQYSLGLMYFNGAGVQRDFDEARRLYQQAARARYPEALNNLGVMYGMGAGVPKDLVEAYAWFALGAALGDRDAARNRDASAEALEPAELERARQRARDLRAELGG